jgi:hypothetical protein
MAPDMHTPSIMSPGNIERLRLPAALVLIAIAAFVLWPRGGAEQASAGPTPLPSVIVGEPGGAVLASPTPSPPPTPIPTATAAATPAPTPAPTEAPPPPPADGFTAQVLVCRSISGSTCNDEVNNLPPNVNTFTALVLFTDATAGDTLTASVAGPGGTLAGSPYALQGSGDGYFWAQFQAAALPSGDYVVTATRNGQEVATTGFRKVGG